MPKFNELPYERPDIDAIQSGFLRHLKAFENAASASEQIAIMSELNVIRNRFMTLSSICSIRHTVNTLDAYYEKENDYIDEISPIVEGLTSDFYNLLLGSPYRKELEAHWGKQLFNIAELQAKTFKPEILEDLQAENKLVSQYTKLRASAKIDFEGEVRNLSQMEPFIQSKDRSIRLAAQMAVTSFYEANEATFDDIFNQLVTIRHGMAQKLGYENYVPLAYAKLMRSDYDHHMVANYRQQVYEHLVPLAQKLREKQAARLGVDALKYYDEPLKFLSGNANPKGTPAEIVEHGREMYRQMSPETHTFFDMLCDNGLMDLESKAGKAGGGYCTFLNDYKLPFIFSNFNGTSGDVDVLTHEAGHAFQVHLSSHFELPEYFWPTYESCEIHSMSMEFFAWPWMELFFKEDTEKYKYNHLVGSLVFIPYGVAVDEFQHFVYENPKATPAERKAKWREIEKKYLPYRDYEDNDFLNRGGFWFRQLHIFQTPFYYIDYTLAQVCAMEFWDKSRCDREQTWQEYLHLCKAGGSKSFLKLVSLAGLHNPFENGTINHVVTPVAKWIQSVDDSAF